MIIMKSRIPYSRLRSIYALTKHLSFTFPSTSSNLILSPVLIA
ncbi:uncharacterized protein METZ01_LOCUS337931 [marine metagenome]|uniref:Uncharacterized protein n=1 Tax=marine metagenome TaxID=408172 RepID=A0A382QJB1_9ZZZZ